jgi:hypothetical protein
VAKFDDLKVIEAEPFEPSTVHAAGVAVSISATTAPPAHYSKSGH